MTRPRRPVRIGLSANFFHADPTRPVFKGKTLLYLDEAMSHWVGSGGALTYLVPTIPQTGTSVTDLVDDLDGLVLQGGADVCPRSYGEEPLRPEWEGDERRDRYEIELIHRFREAGKPVLGVCRGAQIINVAFGGSLFQDITTQVDTELVHRDWEPYDQNCHEIEIVPGTALADLYPGTAVATVNSVHHQAVKDLGDELEVDARSAVDGVVEALRLHDGDGSYVVAVQWHPEWVRERDGLLPSAPILHQFLQRARGVTP